MMPTADLVTSVAVDTAIPICACRSAAALWARRAVLLEIPRRGESPDCTRTIRTPHPGPNLNAAQGKRRLAFHFVHPIWRTAVVSIEPVFILAGKWPRQQVLRTALDGFP